MGRECVESEKRIKVSRQRRRSMYEKEVRDEQVGAVVADLERVSRAGNK
jgi:hypothetical protein